MQEASEATSCDVVVVGSGAGGLATAVAAAHRGLDVVVIEKEAVFGGTTAWSGGWLWVPGNPVSARAGAVHDAGEVRTYLRHALGNRYDEALIEAYLAAAPEMVDFFERETEVAFVPGPQLPDFDSKAPGAGTGRSICAAPYDGRRLGAALATLRPPIREFTLLGMALAPGADLKHFSDATRSLSSALYVARRLGRHLRDVVGHGRGTQLVNGNALAARLVRSALDRGVRLRAGMPASTLLVQDGRVTGVEAGNAAGRQVIAARRGVVLACGGFPHDPTRRRALFPHDPTGERHWSAAPPSNTGDGLRLGESAGGAVSGDLAHAGAWVPVSLVPRADGSVSHFAHLIDRAKPGFIAVTAEGRRFGNESAPYHMLMQDLFRAVPTGAEVAAFLVCDHAAIRRYGLGAVKPFPMPLRPHLASGYLLRGRNPADLARQAGIDPDVFEATIAEYNRHAERGDDPAFGRGSNAFQRYMGDADRQPNPNVAPLDRPPFYAVKLRPGSLGTFAGLRTDANAQVLDAANAPIAGLYAVGNDMASIMGGQYPAGGITLGPAMTFGYIAARHLAGAEIRPASR